MTSLAIFCCTFTLVLGLGLQSLNVNQRRPVAAFFTSFLIGLGNLFLLKTMPQPTTVLDTAAYLLGGPVTAIYLHPRLQRLTQRRAKPAPDAPKGYRIVEET